MCVTDETHCPYKILKLMKQSNRTQRNMNDILIYPCSATKKVVEILTSIGQTGRTCPGECNTLWAKGQTLSDCCVGMDI